MSKRKVQETSQTSAKKQKGGDGTKEEHQPVELSPFEKLPEHVIKQIISFLPAREVKEKMFFLSKHISALISNSTSAMSRFMLKFPNPSDLSKTFNVRKYSTIIFIRAIEGENLKLALDFLKHYGPFIKNIIFQERSARNLLITRQMLEMILKVCTKVHDLKLLYVQFAQSHYKNVTPLDLPELKNLFFSLNGNELINLFKNCQLKSLVAIPDAKSSFDKRIARRFLTLQQSIEHLEIDDYGDLIQDDTITKIKFKLRSLRVRFCFKNLVSSNDTLLKFAMNQVDTLTQLYLSAATTSSFINHLSNFRYIKTLELNFGLLQERKLPDISFTMDSVEEIRIFDGNASELSSKFPNLKKLKIYTGRIDGDILDGLSKIEELVLSFVYICHRISISKLKKMFIYPKMRLKWDEIFDVEENRLKILDLFVSYGCYNWIMTLLQHEDTNLEYLRLRGCSFTSEEENQLLYIFDQARIRNPRFIAEI